MFSSWYEHDNDGMPSTIDPAWHETIVPGRETSPSQVRDWTTSLTENLKTVFTDRSYIALSSELFVFTTIWIFFQQFLSRAWYRYYSRQKYWDNLKSRKGFAFTSHQDEVVYLSSVCPHHTLGGIMMMIGYFYQSPLWIRHGILWEGAFNLQDYVFITLQIYPYNHGSHPQGLACMIVHHFGALFFGMSVIRSPLIDTKEMAEIGLALEAAAALVLLALCYQYCCDLSEDIGKVWLVNLFNTISFFFFRFFLFTAAGYRVFRHVHENFQAGGYNKSVHDENSDGIHTSVHRNHHSTTTNFLHPSIRNSPWLKPLIHGNLLHPSIRNSEWLTALIEWRHVDHVLDRFHYDLQFLILCGVSLACFSAFNIYCFIASWKRGIKMVEVAIEKYIPTTVTSTKAFRSKAFLLQICDINRSIVRILLLEFLFSPKGIKTGMKHVPKGTKPGMNPAARENDGVLSCTESDEKSEALTNQNESLNENPKSDGITRVKSNSSINNLSISTTPVSTSTTSVSSMSTPVSTSTTSVSSISTPAATLTQRGKKFPRK